MDGEEIRARLKGVGRSIQWLAEETRRHPATLYNAFSRNKFASKLVADIDRVLRAEEGTTFLATSLSPTEKREIESHAAREGFKNGDEWMIAKIRGLLAMLRATPPK